MTLTQRFLKRHKKCSGACIKALKVPIPLWAFFVLHHSRLLVSAASY